MNKVTIQNHISQALKGLKIQSFSNRAFRRLPAKQRNIVSELNNFFSNMNTDTSRKVYQYLYYMATQHKFVYPSQTRIGDFADVTDRTVRRILDDLKQHSLIKVHNRGYNSCVYILPPELFSLKVMKQLEGIFGFLKRVTLLALFLSGKPMDSTNVLLVSQESLKLLNIYKLTVERGTLKEEISTKRKTVNQLITPTNQNISANLGLTEYAMLLNTAFDDETLQIAYDITLKNKSKAKNVYAYFFGLCRTICEKMNKKPDYVGMYSRVTAAGFGPGSRTMLKADEDAQPRYDQPRQKIITKADVTADPKFMNPFLAKYGIPEWTKENDNNR